MARMTNEPVRERTGRGQLLVLAVVAVIVGVFLLVNNQVQGNAEDRRADEYYCTLQGVGPDDVAPSTGERCRDLLN